MVMFLTLLVILIWFGLGYASAGWTYAYFQCNWPAVAEQCRRQDTKDFYITLICGPIFFVSIMIDYPEMRDYGWLAPWNHHSYKENDT